MRVKGKTSKGDHWSEAVMEELLFMLKEDEKCQNIYLEILNEEERNELKDLKKEAGRKIEERI